MSSDRVFRVSLNANVKASNPIEAVHLFSQTVGRPGFDQFQVIDDQGDTNVVDMGLLFKMGILRVEQPAEDSQEASNQSDTQSGVTDDANPV